MAMWLVRLVRFVKANCWARRPWDFRRLSDVPQHCTKQDEAPEQMLMTAMDVLEATCTTLVATWCNMVDIVDIVDG